MAVGPPGWAAAIAAPTIPASFSSVADTTRARSVVSLGRNLSDFLLMPPPMMISSGDSSASSLSSTASTRAAHLPQAREGDASGSGPAELVHELADDSRDRIGRGRVRRRQLDPLGQQLAGRDVDRGRLDPRAADVDAENMHHDASRYAKYQRPGGFSLFRHRGIRTPLRLSVRHD